MVRMLKRVTAEEMGELLREAAWLTELGHLATQAQREAFQQRKIDVLERIAADPGPFQDPEQAAETARWATRQARTMRRQLPAVGGEW